MTLGYGYFDNTWQMPTYGDWSTWNTTPYYGSYDYGFGYASDPNSVIAEGSTSSKKEETTGDFLEKQKAREKEVAQARIQAYAQKNMLENGLSKYTTTIQQEVEVQGEDGKPCKQVVDMTVYADANGNPLKFKVQKDEQGNILVDNKGCPIPVFDEKGIPVKDPNGQVVPVCDKKSIEREKQKIEASKKADGSSVESMSIEEYEKLPWWKRAIRATGKALNGCLKMAKGLVGFDENGNWSLKKCLTNVTLVVGSIALTCVCPAAGPALLYAGLVMGAAQVGKGVYNVCTAKNVEELDAAWEDVGQGAAEVVASRGGLKGMAKASGAEMASIGKFASIKNPLAAAKVCHQNNMAILKATPEVWQSACSKNVLTQGGWRAGWQQFRANANEQLNPFYSRTKHDLAGAEARYSEIDGAVTAGTADEALLAEGIRLEQKLNTLRTARLNEIRNNPLRWSKANRQAIGDGTWKASWQAFRANGNLSAGSLGAKGVEYGMKGFMWKIDPSLALWQPITRNAYMVPFKGTETFLREQHYGEGMGDIFTPEACQYYDANGTQQRIAAIDKEIESVQQQMNNLDSQIRQLA